MPAFPWPLTSGRLRHYHFIRGLSARHHITLVSLVDDSFVPSHADALDPLVSRVVPVPRRSSASSLGGQSRKRLAMLTGVSRAVRRFQAEVERLAESEDFDAIILAGPESLKAVRRLRPDTPIVVDVCDAVSMRYAQEARMGPILERPRKWMGYLTRRRFEQRSVQIADHALFASKRDQSCAAAGARGPTTVVPNGVDLHYWRRSRRIRGADTIVFTGAMHFPPNVDAAMHLIRDVFPRVRVSRPGARLLIVGRDPPEKLRRLGDGGRITVTGFVDDVRPYLEEATVFAAPLRFCSGIQNKVLEAMAMEVPVVTSSIAADGVRADGVSPPVSISDDADGFAALTLEHLRRHREAPGAVLELREYVGRWFDWDHSCEQIDRILEGVTRLSAATSP